MPSPLAPAIEAFNEAIAKLDPHGPIEIEEMLKAPGQFFEDLASAWTTFCNKTDDMPVSAGTRDRLRDMIPALNGLKDQGNDALAKFRSDHEVELRRAKEPRPDEERWDVKN